MALKRLLAHGQQQATVTTPTIDTHETAERQRKQVEAQSKPTPAPSSAANDGSEREHESDPTPLPLVASTDSHAVSEHKRKALPSPLKMTYAYQWLTTFDSEFRVRGRCVPESKCAFLIDWLPEEKRKEYEGRGDLQWRDWNTCYTLLKLEAEQKNYHSASKSN